MSKQKSLRIAFFGSSEFARVILDELISRDISPILIISQPDEPQGRGLKVVPTPVKKRAQELNLDAVTPKSLKPEDVPAELLNSEWDLFIVAAYGLLIPKKILDLPLHGTLNVHPSLLPKLRGASPIQTAILNDERESVGTTIILLDEEMDHGSIVAQARISLEDWPIGKKTLEALLAEQSGVLLAETIQPWVKGDITPEPQNHADATFTKKIKREDGFISLKDDPYRNFLKICALEGWPGTFFFVDRGEKKIRVKIAGAEYMDNKLHIKRVVPEGKSEMAYEDFLRGQRMKLEL